MRVAILGISVETMLASPLPTSAGLFQRYGAHVMRKADLWMIRGVFARLDEEADIEAVPLCWATALPGGAIERSAYDALKAEALERLRQAGPLDGVVIVNHGAMEVADMAEDGDTDYVLSVRRTLGPDIPIALSLDLHGDMTEGLLAAIDVVSVLRTAPHRDDKETGYRAADQLVRLLRGERRPAKFAVKIPVLLPGEIAVTALPPADTLYGSLPSFDARPGLWEANILVGFAWNDRRSTSAHGLVVGEPGPARAAALELGTLIWRAHAEFRLRMDHAPTEEGLSRALLEPRRPVYVSDSGDNTTAGAPGDLTLVLQAALNLQADAEIVVAGITAPQTVASLLAAGIGNRTTIALGIDHISAPRTAKQTVVEVEAGGEALDLSGFQPYRSKEAAWARARIGNVTATFHAEPIGITTPSHLRAMGIDPLAAQVYVVKLGYLHPQLEDIAGHHILLLSSGVSALDMRLLSWKAIDRPIYPLDAGFAFSAEAALYGDVAREESARP